MITYRDPIQSQAHRVIEATRTVKGFNVLFCSIVQHRAKSSGQDLVKMSMTQRLKEEQMNRTTGGHWKQQLQKLISRLVSAFIYYCYCISV